MIILVTGAFGFVGHHLIRGLRQHHGADVRLVAAGHGDRQIDAENIESAVIDFTDAVAVDRLIANVKPTHVLHLAARSSVQQAQNAAYTTYNSNVAGTMALAAAMRRHTPGSTMVFASTGEIYGRSFASGENLREDAAVAPANPYARSKLAAEIALQDMLADVCQVITLRLLNHTGPGQDERFVVPSFAAQIARIEAGLQAPVVRVGNLSAERDFLDISDVVDAYLQAMRLADGTTGYRVFNVGSEMPRSIESILARLRNLSHKPFELEQDPGRMRPSDIPRAVCDVSAFRQATGWRPTRAWNQTLQEVLDHWRDACRTSAPQDRAGAETGGAAK